MDVYNTGTDSEDEVPTRGPPAKRARKAADEDNDDAGPALMYGVFDRVRQALRRLGFFREGAESSGTAHGDRIARVRETYEVSRDGDAGERTYMAVLELELVWLLSRPMRDLTRILKTDPNNLPEDIPERVQDVRRGLSALAGPLDKLAAETIITEAMRTVPAEFTKTEKAAAVRKYVPLLMECGRAALTQWDKFIPAAMDHLKHRFLLHPWRAPVDATALTSDELDRFVGAVPGSTGYDIVGELGEWLGSLALLTPEQRRAAAPGGMGAYWEDEVIRRRFPQLAPLGRWYSHRPTSTVAVERAFAIMRNMESRLRMRMTFRNFRTELMLRVNRSMVDAVAQQMAQNVAGRL